MSFFVQTNQDKMEIANENLRADMERWRVEKKNDLKRLLINMADQHILYYQEVKCINSNSISGANNGLQVSRKNLPHCYILLMFSLVCVYQG